MLWIRPCLKIMNMWGGSLEIDVARLYADARDHLPNSDAEDFEDFLREKDRQKGEAE